MILFLPDNLYLQAANVRATSSCFDLQDLASNVNGSSPCKSLNIASSYYPPIDHGVLRYSSALTCFEDGTVKHQQKEEGEEREYIKWSCRTKKGKRLAWP